MLFHCTQKAWNFLKCLSEDFHVKHLLTALPRPTWPYILWIPYSPALDYTEQYSLMVAMCVVFTAALLTKVISTIEPSLPLQEVSVLPILISAMSSEEKLSNIGP